MNGFKGYRTKFKGSLKGIEVSDLFKLDYTLETIGEKMQYVKSKHNLVRDFYETYIYTKDKKEPLLDFVKYEDSDFIEFYKVNLNTEDDLSCDINVFKALELEASYLLGSKDLPKDTKLKYLLLTQDDFDRLVAKENMEMQRECEILEILKPSERGCFINVNLSITRSDLHDPRSAKVLREYTKLKVFLVKEANKIKNGEESPLNIFNIRRMLSSINDDLLYSKKSLQGIRDHAKKLGDESGTFDLSVIDYTNEKHLDCILKLVPLGQIRPDSDMSVLGFDVSNAINKLYKKGELNERDVRILELYNKDIPKAQIGEIVGVSERVIRYRIKRAISRISSYLEPKNNNKGKDRKK